MGLHNCVIGIPVRPLPIKALPCPGSNRTLFVAIDRVFDGIDFVFAARRLAKIL